VFANMKTAQVDVVIAAWNRADTIERAVSSALCQDEVRTVVVVDDGSNDDTAAKARGCDPDGKRVIVERLRSNVGPSAARNIAIEISRAPWLAVLDGDDFFLPGRIATLLLVAEGWDFVADDILQLPDYSADVQSTASTLLGAPLEAQSVNLEQFVLGNLTPHGLLRKELGFLKPLIRRSFLDRHGLRYDDRLRLGEDYALYARALAAGARFLIHPATGYVSLIRTDSLSACHTRQELESFRNVDRDLIAMGNPTAGERHALAKHYSSIDCRVQWLAVIEAFKSHNYLRALPSFFRSPGVSLFLMARLLEESRRRIYRDNVAGNRAKQL
jgi:succinoglycan biosynthesis protein ExoU